MELLQLCDLLRQLRYLRHCNSQYFDSCKVLNHGVELAQRVLIQDQASEHGPRWRREEALWNNLDVVVHQVKLLQAAQGIQLLGEVRHPVGREVEHGQLSEDREGRLLELSLSFWGLLLNDDLQVLLLLVVQQLDNVIPAQIQLLQLLHLVQHVVWERLQPVVRHVEVSQRAILNRYLAGDRVCRRSLAVEAFGVEDDRAQVCYHVALEVDFLNHPQSARHELVEVAVDEDEDFEVEELGELLLVELGRKGPRVKISHFEPRALFVLDLLPVFRFVDGMFVVDERCVFVLGLLLLPAACCSHVLTQ